MNVPVVNLNEGQSISGFVAASTTTGTRLANIEVTAAPSFGNSGVVVQTYTNQNGQYTLWVSSFISNEYNITAAPRGGNVASNGTAYAAQTLYNVSLINATTADFALTPLIVNVTGQIVVADAARGGQLSYPFGVQQGYPAAAIFLQPQGVVPIVDPLGDISGITDSQGNFTVPGLSTGTYTVRAISQGYAVFLATISVSGAGFTLYTGTNTFLPGNVITLQRGATVTGRILNSDGTAPNNTEVGGVAAANFASGQYLVGTVSIDPLAKTVNSYSISGFIPGVSYNIVILPANANDDTVFPPEGANVSFAAAQSTTTQSVNLTYAPPKMECVATAKSLGSGQFQVKVSCNKDMRNQTQADNLLGQIFQVSTFTSAGLSQTAPNGTGQFLSSNEAISTDRRTITAIYATAASETEFSLRLRCSASEINPQTGTNFSIDQVFDFYTGMPSNVSQRITNISGGSVLLTPSQQDEQQDINEQSRIDIQPGTFAVGSDAAAFGLASATTTVTLGLGKAQDLQSASVLAVKAMGYVPSSYHILGNASAFPAETAAAMSKFGLLGSTTNAVGGANPLSAFYTIFLPAGIRHELQVNADLTLSYSPQLSSGSVADNNINVYYYNTAIGQYVIEQTNRRLDPVNQTITVSVNHFSTFLVLDSTPVLSAFNPLSPVSIQMINFPNPVDCIVHSNIQRNSSLFAPGVIPPFQGTMLRFNLPGPTSQFADATIRIYDLAGELVKTIDQGNLGGEFTYYTPWDCTNNSGRTVASGVYIGVIDWAGQRAYDKIAIIKGSGL